MLGYYFLNTPHPSHFACVNERWMMTWLSKYRSDPGPHVWLAPCHSGSVISSDGRAGYYVISPHITPASGGCQGSVCLSKLDKHRTNIFIEENLNFCRKRIFFLWYYEIHLDMRDSVLKWILLKQTCKNFIESEQQNLLSDLEINVRTN